MKKILMAALVAAVAFTSCNKAPKENEENKSAKAPAELKIAYVEVDSIMSQYQFSKDYKAILEKKAQNIQNTLASKQQALEAAAAKLQQDYQANALTQQQAQQRQAAIQQQSQSLQALNQRLSTEFQNEQDKFNQALHDSIANYLKVYNKDKHYSLILTKAGDNILYGDPSIDITKEVVVGLNKVYKPTAAVKEDSKKK